MHITKRSKKITGKYKLFEFNHGCCRQVLNVEQVAALTGVSVKTAERWARGVQMPHPAVWELLRLKACGRVLPDAQSWSDIYVNEKSGLLVLPDGQEIHPRSYMALDMLQDVIKEKDKQIIHYKQTLQKQSAMVYPY